jgi:myo-inositol 2-dehydrogenase/D-chiro-inositol 1-dehydrogenase
VIAAPMPSAGLSQAPCCGEMRGMKAQSIGVIGAGSMGTRHAENLHRRISGARVVAICEPDDARAAAALAICDGARRIADPRALIESPDVDAVAIVSVDAVHAEQALMCVQARKPVLCEKPLAMTSADARGVVEAERETGQQLISLGFMRRFDPQHAAVKAAIDGGGIGRPLLFKGVSRNQDAPPNHPTEILLLNSVIHDFDVMRWIMGADPATVYAQRLRTPVGDGSSLADLFLAHFAFPDGRLATIEAYAHSGYGYDIWAQAVCETGVAETREDSVARVRRLNAVSEAIPPDWLARFQPAYLIEMQAWIDSLRGLAPWRGARAHDGLFATAIAEACMASLALGAPHTIAVGE